VSTCSRRHPGVSASPCRALELTCCAHRTEPHINHRRAGRVRARFRGRAAAAAEGSVSATCGSSRPRAAGGLQVGARASSGQAPRATRALLTRAARVDCGWADRPRVDWQRVGGQPRRTWCRMRERVRVVVLVASGVCLLPSVPSAVCCGPCTKCVPALPWGPVYSVTMKHGSRAHMLAWYGDA